MWGAGSHGSLGDGSTANSDVPVQVPGTWSQVYDGGSTGSNPHTLGVTTAGVVEAWGSGISGELGTGNTKDSSVPVAVNLPAGVTFSSVMAGGFESGAIDSNGNVWMWGRDQNGELGNGPGSGKQLTPVEVDSGKTMLSGTAANVIDG
jgi:alpha-tubulin suppressor-like RCC1 family protein